MIIGISGKIGSGKDTLGSMIQYLDSHSLKSYEEWIKPKMHKGYDIGDLSMYQDEHFGWKIKKFAGKLKEIASLMTGIPTEKFESQDFKKTNLPEEWSINGMPTTVRLFLQKLGTDAIRDGLHENAWVNALFSDYKPLGGLGLIEPNWLITDTRFPNEAKAIKQRGGIVIRVIRDLPQPDYTTLEKKVGLHPSETALDSWEFDEVIENDKGLDKLLYLAEEILKKHKLLVNHLKN